MTCLRVSIALATHLLTSSVALADDYPSKTIKFIVPTAPAGIGDGAARGAHAG